MLGISPLQDPHNGGFVARRPTSVVMWCARERERERSCPGLSGPAVCLSVDPSRIPNTRVCWGGGGFDRCRSGNYVAVRPHYGMCRWQGLNLVQIANTHNSFVVVQSEGRGWRIAVQICKVWNSKLLVSRSCQTQRIPRTCQGLLAPARWGDGWGRAVTVVLLPPDRPGSSVGIATRCGMEGPGIESQCGRDFPHLSRPALWPTQPPVQWVPCLSRG
jgi:hypothetical protein